jgi:hypothetical protein
MNRHSLWNWKCAQQGHILSHITHRARNSSSAFIDGIIVYIYIYKNQVDKQRRHSLEQRACSRELHSLAMQIPEQSHQEVGNLR